jgi:hypothetical protein
MNHKITQIFVPTSFTGSPTTDALTSQKLHVYTPSFTPVTVATGTGGGYTTAGNSSDSFIFAIGSGSTKYGSFKSSVIDKKNVLSVTKVSPDNTTKQQISYIGFDEVNDSKSPSFSCDEEYVVTLKISEYWSKGIFQPMIQESVSVKTACCADCAGGCDSLGCSTYMSDLAGKINASPLLSKYVTASYVYKGSLPTYKWTLTYQDAGNSTAENAVLSALQAYYPSGTYGTIAITADTDGDSDADSLGNTTFEIATPVLTNVADMPLYNGIAWEAVLTTAATVTAAGVKLTGNALDEFGNACVPDAVPYVFNLVRFKVSVHEGPYNTQDFDIEDWCGPWTFTKTQDIKYPIGAGAAMAEMDSVKAQKDAFETALKEKTVALSDMTSKYEASEAQVKALGEEKATLTTNLENAETELNKYNGGGGVAHRRGGCAARQTRSARAAGQSPRPTAC